MTKRLFQAALTLLGVLVVSFLLTRLSGDPTSLLVSESATKEDIQAMREALGLDRSLPVQFYVFMSNALQGDFGMSLRQNTPALGLVLERLPATLQLALTAFAMGLGIAFVLALIVRLTGSSRLRTIFTAIAFTRQAVPVFFFGLLMMIVFSIVLRWLPSGGYGTWAHLILPAFTLASFEVALYLRLFDAAFSEEQSNDYVRTAMSKGQTRFGIVMKHMLPNALLPIVTVAGINLGLLLGGTVVTETVFSWPGMGRLVVQAVTQRDYPVIVAAVVVASTLFILINIIVDLLYVLLDPRVRMS